MEFVWNQNSQVDADGDGIANAKADNLRFVNLHSGKERQEPQITQ